MLDKAAKFALLHLRFLGRKAGEFAAKAGAASKSETVFFVRVSSHSICGSFVELIRIQIEFELELRSSCESDSISAHAKLQESFSPTFAPLRAVLTGLASRVRVAFAAKSVLSNTQQLFA